MTIDHHPRFGKVKVDHAAHVVDVNATTSDVSAHLFNGTTIRSFMSHEEHRNNKHVTKYDGG